MFLYTLMVFVRTQRFGPCSLVRHCWLANLQKGAYNDSAHVSPQWLRIVRALCRLSALMMSLLQSNTCIIVSPPSSFVLKELQCLCLSQSLR